MLTVRLRAVFSCGCACLLLASTLEAMPPEDVLSSVRRMESQPARAVAGTPLSATSTSPPGSAYVQLLSQVLPQEFSTNSTCVLSQTNVCANDCWGYVSPSGREYAIIGLRQGTGFVDITDPVHPQVVGAINDSNSVWSDIRTLGTYAYNVNETGGGLQVIDLSNIDPPTRQVTLVNTLTASGLQTTHNLTLNEDSQTLYLCGSNLGGGRLIAVSLADPANPVIVGSSIDSSYVHDAHVVTYTSGPYAGREIAFAFCGGVGLKILDVTNKANMFRISTLTYPHMRYCHQGRVTDDRHYVIFDDELDELQDPAVTSTTTRIVDVSDLSNPVLVDTFTSGLPTIDHNLFIRGNYVFEADYTSGLQVFNVEDINNAVRVGFYDTYPFNDSVNFDGAWGVWPYFPSGNVIVSDIEGGLFVLDPSEAVDEFCEAAAAPVSGSFPEPKQRYLSISPGNPGITTALRVRLASLPAQFSAHQGEYRWVGAPVQLSDPRGIAGTYYRSRLSCIPTYLDWSTYGSIEISDDAIVPGATYEIQTIGGNCRSVVASNYSTPIALTTAARWGDVVSNNGHVPPNGLTNALDIGAIVDAVRAITGALAMTQADLDPNQPDFMLGAADIARDVDAVKGLPYPFPGPSSCP